jgi:N-acetylneuraminic acid mutarotase
VRGRATIVVAVIALATASAMSGATAQWERQAGLPLPRSEVAAAVLGNEVAIAGGFTADGTPSAEVDAYSPAQDTWRRLPDLPAAVHHAMAAGSGRRLYVLGGYGSTGQPRRAAFVLEAGRWRALPPMPFPRAAAGAAIVSGRIVVPGGVVRVSGRRLARNALVFDLRTRRWSSITGPTPREHLGVTSLVGVVYAVAGRRFGLDTNLATLESWTPGAKRWRSLPSVPSTRGGTGAASVVNRIVSVGGEEPGGTIDEVYAYDVRARRWERLPDLPTPRHGVGVAALGGKTFVIAGGTEPGLSVSSANESLQLTP